MIGRTRPVLLAGGVAGALLVVVLVAARNEDSAAVPSVAPRRPAAAASRIAPPVPDVTLEVLAQSRSDPGAPARNPFRFEARAATSRAPESFDGPVAGPPPAAPPPMFQPPGPPPPSPIPFRFIGLFESPAQSVRVAVLSDGRGNVFHGKEGDIIEGRYKLLGVGADTVELSHLDGRGRQTIRLTGQ